MNRIAGMAGVFLALGIFFVMTGCSTLPKGAERSVQVGAAVIQAANAGIVRSDAQTTTFRIKCFVCGYESAEMVIPTPQPGKPYILHWVCPNCGHKQKVVIRAA